ncbi:MAG: MerR family transcriptional regulator [Pseudomonadota bacterium]|nr:MerR family transcriptional regulator [Pseudomonadota bacterium]
MMVSEFLPIPDKDYFPISEVADLCKVKTHTLRFWEKEFKNLSPVKKKGNRRYYQRKDILLVRRIRSLLYTEGLTISGAKKNLLQKEKKYFQDSNQETIRELKDILKDLDNIN